MDCKYFILSADTQNAADMPPQYLYREHTQTSRCPRRGAWHSWTEYEYISEISYILKSTEHVNRRGNRGDYVDVH